MKQIIKIKKLTACMLFLITANAFAACKAEISRPDSRYEIQNNGSEVKDLKTGLIWQRCLVGMKFENNQCTGVAKLQNWKTLMKEGKNQGWRVPNIKELQTLVDRACSDPAINGKIFPNLDVTEFTASSTLVLIDSKTEIPDIQYIDFKNGKGLSREIIDNNNAYFNTRLVK